MLFIKRFKIRKLIKKIKSMHQYRTHNQASDEALKKEISYYQTLAEIYRSLYGHKHYPFAEEMVLECYRAAASLDDAASQYILGKKLLDEARFREKLQHGEIFASQINESRMKQLYEEAHAYLTAAEKQQHIQARRLHGLCFINGWGVSIDKDKGFELIVESIEQENSWDRVPEIFKAIGLNKPEFFSALTKHRNKTSG